MLPAYNLSFGLRTVDGSNNHLLPGQERWGASDRPFVELMKPEYRLADGTLFEPDGPGGPAPGMPTSPNYNPSNNPGSMVRDASLRMISNLIVDQTLANPSAILTALQNAGVDDPGMLITASISAAYAPLKPLFKALGQAEREEADAAAGVLGGLYELLAENDIELSGSNILIPNFAPDEDLSPPSEIERIRAVRGDSGLRAGLPAEVMAPLKKRSALAYLVEPLTQTLWRTGREN